MCDHLLGRRTALHGDARRKANDVEPGGSGARVRPVEEPDVLGREQQIVRPHIEMQECVSRHRGRRQRFEISQPLEMAARPGVESFELRRLVVAQALPAADVRCECLRGATHFSSCAR